MVTARLALGWFLCTALGDLAQRKNAETSDPSDPHFDWTLFLIYNSLKLYYENLRTCKQYHGSPLLPLLPRPRRHPC